MDFSSEFGATLKLEWLPIKAGPELIGFNADGSFFYGKTTTTLHNMYVPFDLNVEGLFQIVKNAFYVGAEAGAGGLLVFSSRTNYVNFSYQDENGTDLIEQREELQKSLFINYTFGGGVFVRILKFMPMTIDAGIYYHRWNIASYGENVISAKITCGIRF